MRRASSADSPVTHLGRTLLPRADAIVRARRVGSTSALPNGAEIGRIDVLEVLRGPPLEEPTTLSLIAGDAEILPPAGTEALFLLSGPTAGGNFDVVQVASLQGDREARLAAFARYLEIEGIGDPSARREALRTYLRDALRSGSSWSRWNAAREYAALAEELPDVMQAQDRESLASAIASSGDRAYRALLQSALDACPGGTAGVAARAPATAEGASERLVELNDRFSAAEKDAAARRAIVVDAAVRIGASAAPLFERALGDAEAPVREAAVAAAGQLGVASLEARLASMLATETSRAVRLTLVIALGHLRSKTAVPTLAALAREGGTYSREASFALARVRTDEALAALRRIRGETRDVERAELLDFLVSDAFVEQERALRDAR
jgi:hypothetical protein